MAAARNARRADARAEIDVRRDEAWICLEEQVEQVIWEQSYLRRETNKVKHSTRVVVENAGHLEAAYAVAEQT
eukprot:2628522-Heterocapsa_arctica.AAC.1